jgi:asparagine synthase (glutamine-hydrolysing)
MPGIVGIITKMPREWAEPQLLKMLEVLRHESFYMTGTWIDERNGVYSGWTAQENSFSDGMPVRNEREDVVLVFSGEEYPEPGTAGQLKRRGHEFEAEGSSYLVHLYEEDRSFPQNLNGRFHGLVTDCTRGTTTLFNDRYGMHRLYYHQSKEALYFAVEAKAILAVRPELRTADHRSLGEFVSCGCVLENRTLFKDIQVLPAGSAWTFRAGTIERKNTYFQQREWEQQSPLEPEIYHQEIRKVFSQNLPRYLNGRQRIGMSLTGGLDTRMVMAWQKSSPGSFPCYTYAGAYRQCRDVVVARQVARMCQQLHEVILVGNEFLSRFPYYAERSVYLTDGCVDVYRSPDLYLSERVREIAPIRMTGLYGDEVLRHLRAFKPTEPMAGLYSPSFLSYVDAARETYAEVIESNPTSFAVFRQAPWYHYGILALEQTQLAVRTPYLDNDFVRTAFRAPTSATENNDLRLRLIGDGSPALQRIRTDRGFGGTSGYLSAASRSLQEFTFKAEYAYDYGMPQWLSRIDHFFSPFHLERLFLGRHKLYHFRVWYRDTLSHYVREILLDPRTLSRPYIERKGVEAVVKGHLSGKRNYTSEIHRLLSLELLHRLFLDARPQGPMPRPLRKGIV